MSVFHLRPDLVVLLGVRSLLSLAAILIIVTGTWRAERLWDDDIKDEGENGQEEQQPNKQLNGGTEEKAANYRNMNDVEKGQDKQNNLQSSASQQQQQQQQQSTTGDFSRAEDLLEEEDITPIILTVKNVAFGGWLLLGVSYLLERRDWVGRDFSAINITLCILVIIMGFYQSVAWDYLQKKHRELLQKHRLALAGMQLVGMILIGYLTSQSDPDPPLWTSLLGAFCVALSPIVLWFARKKGGTLYESASDDAAAAARSDGDSDSGIFPSLYGGRTPGNNQKHLHSGVVYNFGGPLVVFGWFWLWIGMNATFGEPDYLFLGFYLMNRTFMAFFGAVLVVVVVWMLGYAQDEQPSHGSGTTTGFPPSHQPALDGNKVSAVSSPGVMAQEVDLNINDAPAFGVAGHFFGLLAEVKAVMTAAWMIMGVAAFLPYYTGMLSLVLFASLSLLGLALAFLHVSGYRRRDSFAVKRWTKIVAASLLLVVLMLWMTSGLTALLLSLLGSSTLMIGLTLLHVDRKRGHYWMQTGNINPNYTVYSFGAPVVTMGMLLLAWSLSLVP